MLRFDQPPDRVFLAILHEALATECDQIHDFAKDDKEYWESQYPNISRVFTPDLVITVLSRLLEASKESTLYKVTDYHWVVIYDCLKVFCAIHNDYRGERGDRTVGPYEIGEIDFLSIINQFFWDTDFLIPASELTDIGIEGRHQLDLSEETFGLVHGLAPHPEDLELKPFHDPDWGADPEPEPQGPIVSHYPPPDDE